MDFTSYLPTILLTILILVPICFLYKHFKNKLQQDPYQDLDEPQIASSLGVLGTFIGITYALLFGFDSSDLENSIPTLLSGMTTAFLTSIMGMSASLVMKYEQDKAQKNFKKSLSVSSDATIADLITYLQDQHTSQEKESANILKIITSNNEILNTTIKTSLEKMTDSLVGNGESTLISQLKLMRSELNDRQREIQSEIKDGNNMLITEFRDFSTKIAENNSKAFIEALNNTMKDFNNKLQEQFGENFKQLNIAVGKLLDWQEKYKDTVIATTENQKIIFSGIEDAKISLAEMANTSNSISESAEKLSDIIVTAATYQQTLSQTLTNINTIADQAVKLIPSITQLHQITQENISSSATVAQKNMHETIEVISKEFEQVRDAAIKTDQVLHDSAEKTVALTKQATMGLAEYSTLAIQKINDDAMKILQVTNDSLLTSTNTAQENILSSSETAQQNIHTTIEVISSEFKEVTNAIIETDTLLHNNANKTIEIINTAVNELTNCASFATEQVSNNMITITQEVNKNVSSSLETVSESAKQLIDDSNTAIKDANKTANKLTQSIAKFAEENHYAITKELESLQHAVQNFEANSNEIRKRTDNYVADFIKQYESELKDHTENINKNLEKELNNALNSLGKSLSALSEKFVSDYTPLTDRLREVVEISKRIH